MDDVIAAVISALDAQDPALAADALTAWESLVAMSPASGPTQATVQQYCWATLAQRGDHTPEENWNLAKALAALFTRIGRPRYAQIAAGATTHKLLFLDPAEDWYSQYCMALEAAGVEPPDTDLVTWQDFATAGEIEIIDEISGTLEVAAVAGEFGVGERRGRTLKRRQEITDAVLLAERDGVPLLEQLLDHRIDLWSRYSVPRAELYRGIEDKLHSDAVPPPDAALRAHGLLRLIGDGVTLTDAGYLPPAVVSRAMAELWTEQEWPFPTNREVNARPLLTLRLLLAHVRLLRKNRGRLAPTAVARGIAPDGLWTLLAQRWIGAQYRPESLVAEAVLAAVARGLSPADGARVAPGEGLPELYIDNSDEVAEQAAHLIRVEGWRYGGNDVEGDDVRPVMESVTREMFALGLLRAGGALAPGADMFAAAVLRHRLLHTPFPQRHGR